MLAVHSAMDALQRSASFGPERDGLMRQPSAEDLDAAHQLVSSARGERHGSHVAYDGRISDGGPDNNGPQNRTSPISPRFDASDTPQTLSETTEQMQDYSGLGQVCR
jgi:hypothetical protein